MKFIQILAFLFAGALAQENIDEWACGFQRPATVDSSTPGLVRQLGWSINGTYAPNMECEWHIHDDSGDGIELLFIDFEVEDCNLCRCDRLVIWEGTDDTGNLVGSYCGYVNEAPILITSGDVFIRFVSDEFFEFRGFVIRYGFPLTSTACSSAPDVITSSQGPFLTPDYPADYLNNMFCQWRFEAPEGMKIQLLFLDFEVEGGCSFWDELTIFDGADTGSPVLGRWNGVSGSDYTLPPIIESSANVLLMQFTTDSSVTYRGFFGGFSHVPNDGKLRLE